jgi:hypothetical protein
LLALDPPYTQCERESGGWVCVSDSSRKRQKVDTQSRESTCAVIIIGERDVGLASM